MMGNRPLIDCQSNPMCGYSGTFLFLELLAPPFGRKLWCAACGQSICDSCKHLVLRLLAYSVFETLLDKVLLMLMATCFNFFQNQPFSSDMADHYEHVRSHRFAPSFEGRLFVHHLRQAAGSRGATYSDPHYIHCQPP